VKQTIQPMVARLVRNVANALNSLAPVERDLRVLADALEPEDAKSQGPRRKGPSAPVPTVEFSEVDSQRAKQALAKIGVR
jgi:hypothetical protein